ncbi:DNA polymerase III subunit delta [[Mycoplasma] imitans]|uniref:DNA polymerase III subunit delta n=1 Tax=[Mycoplasma] imitans TaxID=29560 RepID=UPI00048583AD|nr:DNA polymerase III subunit delta [[Mycoplasma] imitans]
MNYLIICDDFYLSQDYLIEKLKPENIVWVNYSGNTNLAPYLSAGLFDGNSKKDVAIINPTFLNKDFDINESKTIINNINNSTKNIYLLVSSNYDRKKEKILKISGKNEIKALDKSNESKIGFIKKHLDKIFDEYPNWLIYLINEKTNFNARLIVNEIKKLEYVDKETLYDSESIENIIIDHSDKKIYNLAKEIINNKVDEILVIYEDLIENKRQPTEIISILITMLSKIYFMLLGKNMKLSDEEIAKKMGVNIYWIKYTYRDIQVKSAVAIKDFIVNLLKLDINNKRNLSDSYQTLKFFIIKGIN